MFQISTPLFRRSRFQKGIPSSYGQVIQSSIQLSCNGHERSSESAIGGKSSATYSVQDCTNQDRPIAKHTEVEEDVLEAYRNEEDVKSSPHWYCYRTEKRRKWETVSMLSVTAVWESLNPYLSSYRLPNMKRKPYRNKKDV